MLRPNRFTLALAPYWMLFLASLSLHAQATYNDWRSVYTWPAVEDSSPDADPDKDGITNLVEYAFGGNPLVNGNNDRLYMPALLTDTAHQPVFRFYRNTSFADIDYIVETSTDLKNWTAVPPSSVEILVQNGTWQTCFVRPPSGEKARFYRVRVNYNPGAGLGHEPYDPSQGIGTVVTPNPFLPGADLKIPKGSSVDPGIPNVGVTPSVIDYRRSDLHQSAYSPLFHPYTEFAGAIETYIGQSGGSAKIGNYELPIPANQKHPFKILDWSGVLDRTKIYPITLTDIVGVDWQYSYSPVNFATVWTSYEKTIMSRAIRDARQLFPNDYPIGWQSANARYLATGSVVGSGRLIGDFADASLSKEEKRGVVSMFGHAHAYGGNGNVYPRVLPWTGSLFIDGDGISRAATIEGATRHSSDISFAYDDPNKFKYTALTYEYKEFGGDKGLKPGVVYRAYVHLLVSRNLTTQKISDAYVPETRPTTDYVEMRMMGGISLPPQCVVEDWDIDRGTVDEVAPNQFIFTATLSTLPEHWAEPMAVKAVAYFTYRDEATMLTAGVDESAGAKYRKIGLNGKPLPDGKPQSDGESDQQGEETFIDAMTLQLRHEATDAHMPIPTSDLALEVRRNASSEVWNHRFGLRPSERFDLPFGVGWRSNLSPSIRFEDSYGTAENPPTVPTATVTDEQGSSFRFLVERNGPVEKFTPFPTAKHEQAAYLCKLEKVGSEYHFTRKYGTKLIYEKLDGMQSIPADRMVSPVTHEDFYSHARLLSVSDRMGNAIDYTYLANASSPLTPSSIAVRGRPGMKIDIHTSDDGVVTDIWDVNGYQTSYRYEKLTDGAQVLKEVVHPNGEITKYTYDLATDADLRPKTGTAAKPDPDYLNYHCDLATITDAANRLYRFEYKFDRSKDDFSVRNGYYKKTGLPRNVYKTHLPNGDIGAIFNNESLISFHTEGTAEDVTLKGESRRQNSITSSPNDPVYAYTRTYRWSDPLLSVVKVPPRLFGDGPTPPSPILVYYQKMELIMPGFGTETFTFDPDAGLALKSVTDLSGNMTRFVHEDPVSDEAVNAYNEVFVGKRSDSAGRVYLNSYYDDPTRQIDAMSRVKFYGYNAKRLLNKITDELGRVTRFDFDNLGRRYRERVYESESSSTPIRDVHFTYGNNTFPGFVTRKTIVALNEADQHIVTEYTPDEFGRVACETIDPGNLALSTHYVYSKGGDLLSQTDARGYKTAFAYDKQRHLTGVFYPNGTAKHYSYDKIGNKTDEIDERGYKSSFKYDALNRVVETTRHMNGDVPDIVAGQKYNPLNQPEEVTDARGFKTLYTYDKIGRLTKVTTPTVTTDNGNGTAQTGALVTTCYYDGANAGGSVFASTPIQPTSTIGPRGFKTILVYDELYRVIERRAEYESGKYAIGKTTYDAVGNPYETTDALGKVKRMKYDALNRPFEAKEPDGGIRTTVYNSVGHITKTIDELNRETSYTYDTAGRLTKTTYPAIEGIHPTLLNEYDPNNNIVATVDARGNRTEIVFDALNRKTWVILPEILDTEKNVYARPITKTVYDEVGNVISTVDAKGNITDTQYDAANRPIKVITPFVSVLNSQATTENKRLESVAEYDANDNIVKTIDTKGNTTINTYDALNRLTSTKDAENQIVFFRYDATGNKTVVIDGMGKITRFTYDGLNRNLGIFDAKGKGGSHIYNEKNEIRRIDAQGRETSYTYDECHRLRSVSYAGRSQDNFVHTYDLAGNSLSIITPNDPLGTRDVVYTYDDGNNVATEQSGRGANTVIHRYYYDLFGNRTKTIYGGTNRELVSTYDAHNRLKTVTESGRTTSYTYDRMGNIIELKLPNGDVTYTTYDSLNRKVTIATGNGFNPLQYFHYAYDACGNVTRIAETYRNAALNRIIENTYDKTHRLIREKTNGANAEDTVYVYDAANNRTLRTVNGAPTSYEYNSLNQLVSFIEGGVTTAINYDSDGNRISRTKGAEITTYAYDYENRLLGVTEPAKAHSYQYDYRTRRVSRQEGLESVRVVFSDGTSSAEYNGSSLASPTVEYMRGSDYGGGIGGILYTARGQNASFTHYNSRGDVTAKTDAAGIVTYQAIYEAFGTRPDEVGSTPDRQHANTKDEDPTGLLNEGLRYRDLETGTFLTRDPMGFVDGPNLYAYVMQNPWTSFDPHGLEAMDDMKSEAWGRANSNESRDFAQEMHQRSAIAAGIADTVIAFFSYTAALLYEGAWSGPFGPSSPVMKAIAPETCAELNMHIDLATHEMVQQPRKLVTDVFNVADDDSTRNTVETIADVATLVVGLWKAGTQAPKYIKAAKLYFAESKAALSLAAKESKGAGLLQKIKGLKDWWMKGAEHDAEWRKLSLKDKFFHEIGNNTHIDDINKKYLGVSNSVEKGKLMWKELGARRAIFSTVRGSLFLGAGKTLPTGPTSLVRWAVPRFAGPLGYAAYEFYTWLWHRFE